MNKPFVCNQGDSSNTEKKDLSLFEDSYDTYCISKHFSSLTEKEDSFEQVAASVSLMNNREYQFKNLGWKLATEENRFVIKKLLDMKPCYNQKNISLDGLKELIVKIDPYSIRILILSPFVQKELILKKMLTFNPETKCYEYLGRQVVPVESNDLNDKIIFICNQLLYIITDGLSCNEIQDEMTVTKNLALWYSHRNLEEDNFEVLNL